jgi:hypothetical protein
MPQLNVRIPDDMHRQLKLLALDKGTSLQALLQEQCAELLSNAPATSRLDAAINSLFTFMLNEINDSAVVKLQRAYTLWKDRTPI